MNYEHNPSVFLERNASMDDTNSFFEGFQKIQIPKYLQSLSKFLNEALFRVPGVRLFILLMLIH